ncbi:DNA gyrase subunit B (plasmid) [Aneurinibacillus sp. Ricciae_BoGa-3]|uniref:DNA gyrase/topoisomerase IV subunit B n=1 Tax=Aneurinibacillus sp. Ricciae_BoGa-3 TaxID=3022697 RepID=UPI00233FA026|nr:DNA gyrase subunit B [Aneurinibacillus sp. Ricciae_BoGa-3]WCK56953.1 DNA gyrase subunit B [Aneurinibacillus sp. Ricciae_BoGa-3]
MSDYNGSSVRILEGLEAVRVRPGMYIGSTNSRGLHHLVWEVVDNSIDEALAGYCTAINVWLKKDGSITVLDNGRGVPVDRHPDKLIATERILFTVLHAGGKFDNDTYKVSGGLHGVGASVVNALSSWLEVEVYRDGKLYRDRYEKGGNPTVDLVDGLLVPIADTDKRGTKVSFKPDDTIFETVEFKADIIKKRLRELSFLNKGLLLTFEDENTGEKVEYYEEEGIVGLVRELNKTKDILNDDVVYVTSKSNNIEVEIAFQYTNEFTETILSYCNNINTVEGGTHVSGFKTAFTRIINQYAREIGALKEKEDNFEGKDVRNGITAIVLVKHPNPQYEGQTKTKLGNSDARGAVDEVFSVESQKFFDRNIETLKSIIDNAMKALKLRKAEEKVRTNLLANSKLAGNGKLASASSKNPDEVELILVEGDSAGGSAKQGRDRSFQAILPLRGKVLNVEKKEVAKVISNTEIQSIINAIGCGFGEGYGDDFDIQKRKVKKVIILTDADVDGSHIRTLLLTFFHRYMPELIYEGLIYRGVPPLYKVTSGKEVRYCYSDRELEELKPKLKGKIEIQRYKGLGEMNPEQLWETTLNPQTRLLKQITIEDAVMADEITNVLMGDKVEPRRDFIYENALLAEIDL